MQRSFINILKAEEKSKAATEPALSHNPRHLFTALFNNEEKDVCHPADLPGHLVSILRESTLW